MLEAMFAGVTSKVQSSKMNWESFEIQISVPFSELAHYPDEDNDLFIENPRFQSIRDLLGIKIDVVTWVNECYSILQGEKHLSRIELFYSQNRNSYILLDNYMDPKDQLDLIIIGIKTTGENSNQLKLLSREFNDACKYSGIHYEEGTKQFQFN
jgi:hypothetical protein